MAPPGARPAAGATDAAQRPLRPLTWSGSPSQEADGRCASRGSRRGRSSRPWPSGGGAVAGACRRHGVGDAAPCEWEARFGGTAVSDARGPRGLQGGTARRAAPAGRPDAGRRRLRRTGLGEALGEAPTTRTARRAAARNGRGGATSPRLAPGLPPGRPRWPAPVAGLGPKAVRRARARARRLGPADPRAGAAGARDPPPAAPARPRRRGGLPGPRAPLQDRARRRAVVRA